MKYLVVLLVVLAVLWLVRGAGRRIGGGAPPGTPPAPPLHDAIVACAQCGLHLPRGEALPGRGGVFCCETHRSLHERAHPPG